MKYLCVDVLKNIYRRKCCVLKGLVWILPGPNVDARNFEPVVPSARVGSLPLGSSAHTVPVGFAILPAPTVRPPIVEIKPSAVHMGSGGEGGACGSRGRRGGLDAARRTRYRCSCIHTPEKIILSVRPPRIRPEHAASLEHILSLLVPQSSNKFRAVETVQCADAEGSFRAFPRRHATGRSTIDVCGGLRVRR